MAHQSFTHQKQNITGFYCAYRISFIRHCPQIVAAQSGAHSGINATLKWDTLKNGAKPKTHSKLVQYTLTTRQLWGRNTYRISSIRHIPLSNSSRTIENTKQNKHRPQIVFTASICNVWIHILILAANAHCAISRAVRILRTFPQLSAGPKGCVYYYQRLSGLAVLPTCALFSRRCYPLASQQNTVGSHLSEHTETKITELFG